MPDSNPRGKFVWYDLMTTDPQGAQAFYTRVLGWGTEQWAGDMPYTMWTSGAGGIGGVMPLPEGAGAPPHWLGYIGVLDADATTAQAEGLGGRILVPPSDIPSVGRFAVIADPQGAAFAVFTPAGDPQPPDTSVRVGNVSWHELMTTDYRAAFRFYQALFGWEQRAEHDMGPLGIYSIFGAEGKDMGGMFNRPAGTPIPPNWLQYVMVDSVERVSEAVKANAGTVMMGPHQVPGGDWISQCKDPQGAAFAIQSRGR